MTKLCARGKAAAKKKFKVYPSAYANAYASKICAGKAKDPSGLRRKDFKGPKPVGKVVGGEAKIKKVIGGLKKASKTHAAQAKSLQSVVKASLWTICTKIPFIVDGEIFDPAKEFPETYIRPKGTKNFMCGGEVRGTGAAIKGTKFKGVF
mgnify:CR=1 FL=1